MAKKASKTAIGAFVVGAVALGVVAVLVFGSGKFFSDRTLYVMFFDGSLKGLQVGAPVVMNGVKIGEVTGISVVGDPATLKFYSPVYIEIDPEKIRILGNEKQKLRGVLGKKKYALYERLLEKGMKGQLVLQSFVTGQLWISLGLYPDKPVKLVGAVKDVPEIPTIPTTMEELQKTVENIPIKEIAAKLDNVITGIDRLVNSPEMKQTLVNLEKTTRDIGVLVRHVDNQVEPISADVRSTLDAAKGTLGEANKALASAKAALDQAEKTLAFKEGVPGQMAEKLMATLDSARSALDESKKALVEVQDLTSQSAYIGYEVGSTLEETKSLSRSIRSLSDYLERHPESLIRGKSPEKGDAR
jgi:paraquat-inducible protein B